ncbi:hypothetical protein EC991_002887 [Linnemannia zychae]|nr:hypothetical protein EC991_002887 [Linnemannia zychae]
MDLPPPAALRKIVREVHSMVKDPPEGIRMIISEDISDIQAWIQGPESALNEEAGRLLLERYGDYAQRARLWTNIHALSAGKDIFTPLKRAGADVQDVPDLCIFCLVLVFILFVGILFHGNNGHHPYETETWVCRKPDGAGASNFGLSIGTVVFILLVLLLNPNLNHLFLHGRHFRDNLRYFGTKDKSYYRNIHPTAMVSL